MRSSRARSLLHSGAVVTLVLLFTACRTRSKPSGADASATEFKPVPLSWSGRPAEPIASALARHHRGFVTVELSETDIQVPHGNYYRSFSYESWAEWWFRHELGTETRPLTVGSTCTREIKVTPVAWIAPLLGLHEEIYQTCPKEAHPGGETRLTTLALDVDRHSYGAPRPIVLTELFDAPVIAAALRADPIVVKALRGSELPLELDALVKALAETPPVVEGKHCYSFPEDLLERFALHHSEGTHVAVRIGLPGTGPCRYAFTELGLLLPLPASLRPALEHMGEHNGSFFVVDRPDMAKTAVIHVTSAAPN